MGFSYLEGKNWTEVTRDERFFCQRLYELIKEESAEVFIEYLSMDLGLGISLKGEWEVGYEVCFYRDLWQLKGRKGSLFSPKRTFDLCLFGETTFIIIEAKAAGCFDPDQNNTFRNDMKEVEKLTGVKNVRLIGLCSSKCDLDKSSEATFGKNVIHWKTLSERYNNDEVLARADDIYQPSKPFVNRGRNSNIKLSGAALLEAFKGGASWWVGRGGGGLKGELFKKDILSGKWKTQNYEVNTVSEEPPSPNYFELAKFFEAIEASQSDDAESDKTLRARF